MQEIVLLSNMNALFKSLHLQFDIIILTIEV
jgi:hypothetical protein